MNSKSLMVVTLAALAGSMGTGSAADFPAQTYTKAAPVVAPIYNWGGLYIGLNGGGGSSRKCWDINNALGVAVASTAEGCHDATGGLAGGQIGYRLQAGSWVFGAEAQGDWADLKGSNNTLLLPAAFRFIANNNTKIDMIGLFTGQVGYAWNNILWYVKGGAATTHDKYNGRVAGVIFDTANESRWGATVGTGVEIGFAPGWSVAFEYDHLFMGSRNNTFAFTPAAAPAFAGISRIDNIRQDVDMGTVRVNYTFGSFSGAVY